MTYHLGEPDEDGNYPRIGMPATLADKVFMMEQGLIPRDEALLNNFYSAKRAARHKFYDEMSGVSGWIDPRNNNRR